jgi:hypothetical protein
MGSPRAAVTWWRLAGAVLVAVGAIVALALASPGTSPGRDTPLRRTAQATPELLFVQDARRGTFTKRRGAPGYLLRLRGVDRKAVYFSDRPVRDTGVVSVEAMLLSLYSRGETAPNAAVELVGRKSEDVVALELRRPRYNPRQRTLSFVTRRLRAVGGALTQYRGRLDGRLPRRFGNVSLFIDAAYGYTCAAELTNRTSDAVLFLASNAVTKKDEDDWERQPIDGLGPSTSSWATSGGLGRGCWNRVVYSAFEAGDTGVSIDVYTSNPFTGDNEAYCRPSSTRKYTCTLDSQASNLTGPILLVKWVLTDSD